MKIIHIHPSYLMALRFVKPLIEYEKLIGHDTQLIVFDKNFNENFATKIDLRLNNLKLLIEIFKFVIFLLKKRPDVVICHNSVQATIPLLFSKILRINQKIYFNHGVTYLGYNGILRGAFYIFEWLNSFLSDQTITVSTNMKKYLDQIKPNTKLINNGSACGVIIPKRPIKKKKSKFPIRITFVGRLHIRKGIKTLIEIIKHFENNEKVKFIFCGFTKKEFSKFSNKDFKNLECKGFVEDVNKILITSDILLLPSHHEGLPYSILEAMINKNLILGNNIPGINNIIVHNENGILINDNNTDQYIYTINDFIKDRLKYNKHLENALLTINKYERNAFLIKYGDYINNLNK